jgi:hypothetical protein
MGKRIHQAFKHGCLGVLLVLCLALSVWSGPLLAAKYRVGFSQDIADNEWRRTPGAETHPGGVPGGG